MVFPLKTSIMSQGNPRSSRSSKSPLRRVAQVDQSLSKTHCAAQRRRCDCNDQAVRLCFWAIWAYGNTWQIYIYIYKYIYLQISNMTNVNVVKTMSYVINNPPVIPIFIGGMVVWLPFPVMGGLLVFWPHLSAFLFYKAVHFQSLLGLWTRTPR